MKNRKAISWIFFAIVLTSAAHILLWYKGDVAASLVQRSALLDEPFLKPDAVSVEVRGKSAALIERQDDDWRMVSPYSALADERVVMRLLDMLSVTMIEDTLGDMELLKLGRTREDFGLEDPEAKVRVNDGSSSTEIAFGCTTPSGGGVYATVNDEKAVYVVSSNVLAAANLPPDGFRKRSIFPALGGAVSSFDLKRGTGSFMRFIRFGDTWMMHEPEQSTANSQKVKDLLAAATTATAVEFVWPVGANGESATASASLLAGYGLDPESAVTLTIRCSDGVDSQVSFGKEAKDGLVYALMHSAGAIATVDAKLKDLALAGVQDFTDTRIFPVDARSATRISVSDGGVTYLLAKDDSGEWRLDAPVVAKTDKDSVDAFLKRLFDLKSADLDSDGISVIAVTSAPPAVVSRAALLGDMRLEDLRSREIINVDPKAVRRLVSAPRGDKPTAVVYDRDRRAWNVEVSPVPGSVSTDGIDTVLAALSPVNAQTIVKLKVSASELREFGLDSPRFSVAVDSEKEDSIRRNLLVGDRAEGGGFYATLGATDAVFVISGETVDKLMSGLVKADGSEKKDTK